MTRFSECFALLALVSGTAILGCGPSGPELTEVTGTVTLDGKPVPKAVISFLPSGETGSPSYGRTDLQGKYELGYSLNSRGARLGSYNVEITTSKLSKEELDEIKASGEEVPAESVAIPDKYKEASALTAEVKAGPNVIDFALTSD